MSVDVKYDFTPHDGTPGKPYDDFEDRLLNYSASEVDDRGWSHADHYQGVDEGGALGPAMPAPGTADGRKAINARRKREKSSYGLLTKHITDLEHVKEMKSNHFQNGRSAFAYYRGACSTPVDRMQIRELDGEWDGLDLLADVGVNENSIKLMTKKIRHVASKRPATHPKSHTEMAERLLELIFSCSKHFSESAMTEYNAPAAQWAFVIPAGAPNAGQRDLNAIEKHFHALWSQAVHSRLAGFHVREPVKRPATADPRRNTVEGGLAANETRFEQGMAAAGSLDTYVPRAGSPSKTLALLAEAGDPVANQRGVVTTSDWGLLTRDEIAAAASTSSIHDRNLTSDSYHELTAFIASGGMDEEFEVRLAPC